MMRLRSLLKRRTHKHQKASTASQLQDARFFERAVIHIMDLLSALEKPQFRSQPLSHLLGKKPLKTNDQTNEELCSSKYGILEDQSYQYLKQVLMFLVQEDYIRVLKHGNQHLITVENGKNKPDTDKLFSKFEYFNPSQEGREFFENYVKEFIASKPFQKEKKDTKKADSFRDFAEENRAIYRLLVDYRNAKAKEQDVPPYVVFHNRTLANIASALPTSLEGLATVQGVGEKRLDQYGKDVIDIIHTYQKKTPPEKNEEAGTFEAVFSGERFVGKKEMLEVYERYKEGRLSVQDAHKQYLYSIDALEAFRQKYNERYVAWAMEAESQYLDDILKPCDPKIKLDAGQREAVLRDEDHTLVVAGAGAGKTTTVAAKVKYLVDRKNIDPEKILIVSYTNDAVNELKTRINTQLNIPSPITTFHKTGYAIVKKHRNMEKSSVVHEGMMFNIIRDYLHEQLAKDPKELEALVLFFGYYIDYQLGKDTLEGYRRHHQRNDFTTLKANLEAINAGIIEQKQQARQTIRNEVLRSIEEVQIANFLYLHKIDYQYEAPYPYHIEGSTQLYTPDFTIKHQGKTLYLEHFGIHEDGTHSRYSPEELQRYKRAMQEKIALHKDKGTKLLYTFSAYNDKKPLLHHLRKLLEKEGIPLEKRSPTEIYEQLKAAEDNKYLNKFIFLIKDFIQSFKVNGYTEKDFVRLYNKTQNVRNRMFLKLCKPIYLHYQQLLQENDLVDFEDMINHSAEILQDPNTKDLIPDFQYVIVDEYQDISQQRFDLTQELAKLTNAKIIAVGDDWQSIFAFAGSRIQLFLDFKKIMGYADYLNIDYTYRNAQEIIDIAGDFVQKNTKQLRKHLKSPKHIRKPVVLYEYSDLVYKNEKKGYKGIIHEKARICSEIIGKILKTRNHNNTVTLLGRYNFEFKQLANSDFFTWKQDGRQWTLQSIHHPKVKLIYMTVHAAKGLGFDNVIILNGSDEVFGFPCQIEMDPLLRLVKFDDRSYSYAEERRLFYVALTRTKNRVFILYPKSKPSTFVKEIADDNESVVVHGELEEEVPLHDRKEKLCPHCGYPLQLKHNHAYGLKLYMCTNEPELCDYMTNNLRSGKESIRKCDQCKDGYLIVKHSQKTGQHFFGCTNYKSNRKGCNRTSAID